MLNGRLNSKKGSLVLIWECFHRRAAAFSGRETEAKFPSSPSTRRLVDMIVEETGVRDDIKGAGQSHLLRIGPSSPRSPNMAWQGSQSSNAGFQSAAVSDEPATGKEVGIQRHGFLACCGGGQPCVANVRRIKFSRPLAWVNRPRPHTQNMPFSSGGLHYFLFLLDASSGATGLVCITCELCQKRVDFTRKMSVPLLQGQKNVTGQKLFASCQHRFVDSQSQPPQSQGTAHNATNCDGRQLQNDRLCQIFMVRFPVSHFVGKLDLTGKRTGKVRREGKPH